MGPKSHFCSTSTIDYQGLPEKPTDSNCNSGCASPRLCEEMTLGSTFQIGGSPIDFLSSVETLSLVEILSLVQALSLVETLSLV